jgi:hypothetical protein
VKVSACKRIAIAIVSSVAACMAVGIVSSVPASAADYAARGPSAGADQFGDQFVFWRGSTNSELYEAYYSAYTNSWSGALNLSQMGKLGSEPSVAVSDSGGYLSNGNRMGAQYVYWKGNNGHLWYAYWAGSWNGAFDTGIGNIASQPSAVFNDVGGVPQVTVFWESTTDSSLSYVRIANPASANPTYYGPHPATFNGQGFGTLGSSPGASNSTPTSIGGDGYGVVAWKGSTNQNLWEVSYSINWQDGALSFDSLPFKASQWGNLNSGPSVTAVYTTSQNTWYYVWEDSSQNLYFAIASEPAGKLDSGLGSAPSIAWSAATFSDVYVFWKGQDGYLKEAFFNGTTWKSYSYPSFGILG